MNYSAHWVEDTLKKLVEKERATVLRNRGCIPYRVINGVYEDMNKHIGWWTNGFWGGILWQMYQLTGEELFREEAAALEEKMDAVFLSAYDMDHDSGFRWLPTSIINHRLTGNKKSWDRGILAADNLMGRFNPAGRFLRAWNPWGKELHTGWAIIDCMMNLPLLVWAAEQRFDPRYLQVARMHADRVLETFIREDGSVKHIVSYDPETGAYIEALGGQGYDADSAWTRGQAWALYGFTLAYQQLKEERYLHAAEKIAEYVMSQTPESGLIPVDFRQPKDCTDEDSIAAATLACGLIELSRSVDDGQRYLDAALKLLHALDDNRANYDSNVDNVLDHCSVRFHEEDHNQRIVYADYYYIEAFMKLAGKTQDVW